MCLCCSCCLALTPSAVEEPQPARSLSSFPCCDCYDPEKIDAFSTVSGAPRAAGTDHAGMTGGSCSARNSASTALPCHPWETSTSLRPSPVGDSVGPSWLYDQPV